MPHLLHRLLQQLSTRYREEVEAAVRAFRSQYSAMQKKIAEAEETRKLCHGSWETRINAARTALWRECDAWSKEISIVAGASSSSSSSSSSTAEGVILVAGTKRQHQQQSLNDHALRISEKERKLNEVLVQEINEEESERIALGKMREDLMALVSAHHAELAEKKEEYEAAVKRSHQEHSRETKALVVTQRAMRSKLEAWQNEIAEIATTTKKMKCAGDDVAGDQVVDVLPQREEIFLKSHEIDADNDTTNILVDESLITYKSLYALRDGAWINDEVINFLTSRLMFPRRNKEDPVFCFSSFDFNRLVMGEDVDASREATASMFERWGYNRDAKAFILPMNLRSRHWAVAMIANGVLYWYDSLGWDSTEEKAKTRAWFSRCFHRELEERVRCYPGGAEQKDSSNCGVYAALRMKRWARDEAWNNVEKVFGDEITREEVTRARGEFSVQIVRELLRMRGDDAR